MKNTLSMLLQLSELDSSVQELQDARAQIPLQIKDLERQIQTLENEMKTTEQKSSDLTTSKTDSEKMIREKKEWIESREILVKDIKTNKEYHAALKEVATAKKEISDRETQINAYNDRLGGLTQEIETTRTKNTPQIEALKIQIEDANKAYNELNPQVEERQKNRNGIAIEIDPKMLAIYDQIRQRVTPVMAKAESGICTECGTKILPQLFNRLHSMTELLTCPRCKRILYLEEVVK